MGIGDGILRLFRGKTIKRIPVSVTAGPAVHRLSIVCIVRNEAENLEEWLLFHLAQGVGHVYVYDNESTDATRRILAPHVRAGHVSVIPWVHRAGYHTQARAYAHALETFGGSNRWMAFIDVDEFMFCPGGEQLPNFLLQFEHRPALLVHRHTYGTSGFDTPPGNVTAKFVWRTPVPDGPFHMKGNLAPKSIVQPLQVAAVNGAHTFLLRGTGASGFDEADEPLSGRQAPAFRAEHIRINHYYTKDRHTFMRRISRGRTASNLTVPEWRWRELLQEVEAHAAVHDDSICHAWFPADPLRGPGRAARGIAAVPASRPNADTISRI